MYQRDHPAVHVSQLSFYACSLSLLVLVLEGVSSLLPDVDEGTSVEWVCWNGVGLPRCTMASLAGQGESATAAASSAISLSREVFCV
mmetsp:Transcript_21541/g.52769  ORF Transcript_21541/g.52769 Transcript_21541/m.52769 type:complete len:87 (-) Transcript_21541:716-976(-)